MNPGLSEVKAPVLCTRSKTKELAGVLDTEAFEAFPALKIRDSREREAWFLKNYISNILLGFLGSEKRILNCFFKNEEMVYLKAIFTIYFFLLKLFSLKLKENFINELTSRN